MEPVLAGPQALLRSLNARAVLDVIDAQHPIGRPEIVTATGLSRTTIAQTLQALVDSGVVVSAGLDTTRRGPAATVYRIDPNAAVGIAAHCSAEAVSVAIVDVAGAVRATARTLGVGSDPRARAEEISRLAHDCLAESSVPGAASAVLDHAVIGVPGIVQPDRRTLRSVPGFEVGGTALHDALTAGLGCPVVIENDLNLSAIAEQRVGRGRALDTFVVLSLESGFGAGLIVNGRLFRGSAGGAGEVAFLPYPGLQLGEEALGRWAVAEIARSEGLDPLRSLADHLHDAGEGSSGAERIATEVARRIAVAAAGIALVLDPESFVLTGLAAHDQLAPRVAAFADTRMQQLPLRFVTSDLGHRGTITGATELVRDALRETAFAAAIGQ
ncbi:ROK family protein [Plantibacter sp. Mn2098]|uniref:ROK family protein n=1 Tax=Plantibacter sp. Mn2098 TaxID=3395266 RepID=UPI003BDF69D5